MEKENQELKEFIKELQKQITSLKSVFEIDLTEETDTETTQTQQKAIEESIRFEKEISLMDLKNNTLDLLQKVGDKSPWKS